MPPAQNPAPGPAEHNPNLTGHNDARSGTIRRKEPAHCAVFKSMMRQHIFPAATITPRLVAPLLLFVSSTASAADPASPFTPPPVCEAAREETPPAASGAQNADSSGGENREQDRPPPLPTGLADYALRPVAEGGFEVTAAIVIAAPRGLVRETLTDCGEAFRYMPGMRLCKVLDSGPDYDVTRHKIKRYWLLPGADFIFRARYHLPERIDVKLVEGNLRRLEARWSFCAVDENTTRLVYQASIEAGWYVSQRAERRTLERDLPEMLRRMKSQSEARRAMIENSPALPADDINSDTTGKPSNG